MFICRPYLAYWFNGYRQVPAFCASPAIAIALLKNTAVDRESQIVTAMAGALTQAQLVAAQEDK